MDQRTAENEPQGVRPEWIAGTNFIMLHLDLVDELDGDFHAALLLDRIRFRAGDRWWTATREQLMADTRLNEYHLKRALNTLRERGLVQTERTSAYDATLRYRVVFTAIPDKAYSAVSTRHISPPEMANSAVSEMANSAVSTITLRTEEELPQEVLSTGLGFDEFWDAYPKKRSKGQAEKTWAKVVKDTDPRVIVHGAVEYARWCERSNEERQFIPYPSSWLNAKGWLDEREEKQHGTEMDSRMQGWIAVGNDLAYNEISNHQVDPLELEG